MPTQSRGHGTPKRKNINVNIDRWQIDRRVRNGRTEFWFKFGGELEDLGLIEDIVVKQMGGKVTERLSGPCGENGFHAYVRNHSIHFCNDYYDILFFFPANECDADTTESFASKLKEILSRK